MSFTRRNLSRAATALMGSLVIIAMGSSAQAVDYLPDGQREGTLVIHKKLAPSGAIGNGLPNPVANAPVAGVEFTIEKIAGIDLTTRAGWEAATTATTSSARDAAFPAVVGANVDTTDVTGEVTFANLPLGLYVVTETATPPGIIAAAPFLVTIPLTHPTALNEWLYDVHVYPKNSQVGVTKTTTDAAAAALGDVVTWTVLADVPAPDANSLALASYAIQDTLDSKLTLVDTNSNGVVEPPDVVVALTTGTATLAAGDYTVTYTGGTRVLRVEFTSAGLTKLGTISAGQKVEVTIKTTVNAVGVIDNAATLFVNGSQVTSSPATTKWAKVEIDKVAFGGQTLLPGAQFKVFLSEADALAGTNAIATSTVSDVDGRAVISGLRYSDWENGATKGTPRVYWITEVLAPEGYELNAEPKSFTVTAQATGNATITFANVPHNAGFHLPAVGGVEWALPTLAALTIAAGLATLSVLAIRRRTNHTTS